MTAFTSIRNSEINNPKGVMESCLSYQLQQKVESNVRLYFYRFNVDNVIEILYKGDVITAYYYSEMDKNRVHKLADEIDFLSGYFKSAGLEGSRFLYDLELKMPVAYADFVVTPNINLSRYSFLFILDKKDGYVSGENACIKYTTTLNTPVVDKSILSFMNDSIGVANTKILRMAGCETAMVISALLNGAILEDIVDDLDKVSGDKFVNTINKVNFSSDFVNERISKLKTGEFKKKVLSAKKNDKQDNFLVSLNGIIAEGLDHYLKTTNTKSIIRADIDCEWQAIKNAWINGNTLYIVPAPGRDLAYFKVLFNSDNIKLVDN